jgi:hypothetical protein
VSLHLVSSARGQDLVRLEVCETLSPDEPHSAHARNRNDQTALPQRILSHLAQTGPSRHRDLRTALSVRDKRLSETLRALEAAGRVAHTPSGWNLLPNQ